MAFHLVVTGVAWSISLASGGTGRLLLAAVVIQLSAITGFSAFGGLVGGWFSSRLTAPVVLLALLGANTLFAQYGFRRISDTGTGSADVVDLVYDPAYVLPKVVLYAGLVALALPVRFDRSWVAVTRSATASAVVVLALAWVWTSQASPFRLAPEARMCQSRYVQVCEPVSFGRRGVAVDTAVSTAVQLLRADGVTDVPGRVDVVSRATVVFPAGSAALYVSPATVENPRALRREVARALSAAQSCDDPAAVAAPDEQVLTDRATLDGWLQVHTDSVEVGSFPPDRVAALDADPDRRHVLAALFSRVWTCSGVAVR